MQNKIIGIIGGIAPPSTIDYYQKIINGYHGKTRSNQYPSILINSINMTKMLDLVFKKEFNELVDFLNNEIQKIADGGADFAVLASNTPHIVFDQLQNKSKIPLISIVDVTVQHAKKMGLKRPGLFGTKSTMQGGFYQDGFAGEKMEIIIPQKEEQDFIHDKYMSELVKEIVLTDTKKKLIEIANRMAEQDKIDSLILGGTELPLILNGDDFGDLVLLNTTEIHVESILENALKN